MRVAVVGDGLAALCAAQALGEHSGVQVTLVGVAEGGRADDASPVPESEDGGAAYRCSPAAAEPPLTGLLSRHGCPNLARWYDGLHLSLGFCDAGTRDCAAAAPRASSSAERSRLGQRIAAALARELQHTAGGGSASASTELDGTLENFCRRQDGTDAAAALSWLPPLAAAVWAVPTADAAGMSARPVLRTLFENGLLVQGGDGSGGDSTWWSLRPRGGMAGVHRRARERLRTLGVELPGASGRLRLEPASGGGVDLLRGGTDLGHFDQVILGVSPRVAADLIEAGELADGGTRRGWVEALRMLATLELPMHQVVHNTAKPLAGWLPESEGAWSSCMVPSNTTAQDDGSGGQPVVAYWLRSVRQESFGMEGPHPVQGTEHFVCVHRGTHTASETHPSRQAVAASVLRPGSELLQQQIEVLQGSGGVWYASPLLGDGLHESSIVAALRAVRALLPKQPTPIEYPVWRNQLHLQFVGRTTHRRPKAARSAVAHGFSYKVRYDYTNVDAGFSPWWGGLVREDHFGDPAISLGESIRQHVAKEIGVWVTGPVDFLGSLREWGYCFNPIGLYYCWEDTDRGRLLCVVSAVTNTPWGQRSLHVLPIDSASSTGANVPAGPLLEVSKQQQQQQQQQPQQPQQRRTVHQREKRLHVSPFNHPPDGEASWRYSVSTPSSTLEKIYVGVSAFADAAQGTDMLQLAATLTLHRARPTACDWLRAPYSLKVQFLIHWQAVLLLRKGMTFHSNTTCPLASSKGAISHGAMVALALVVVLVGVLLAVVVFGLVSTAAQQALSEGTHASQFTQ
jgi:DUF1365 family protein/predicted NAD/FAD-binding protein